MVDPLQAGCHASSIEASDVEMVCKVPIQGIILLSAPATTPPHMKVQRLDPSHPFVLARTNME